MRKVLLRPIISEKSMRLAKEKRYTFLVDPTATKHAISRAVHDLYGVDVVCVSTIRTHGKTRRTGRLRRPYTLPGTKKAVVQVKPDQSISVFDIEGGKE